MFLPSSISEKLRAGFVVPIHNLGSYSAGESYAVVIATTL